VLIGPFTHIVEPIAAWRRMSGQLTGNLRIIVSKSMTV
jgi:hypothetical protein